MRATRKCVAGQIWRAGQGLRTADLDVGERFADAAMAAGAERDVVELLVARHLRRIEEPARRRRWDEVREGPPAERGSGQGGEARTGSRSVGTSHERERAHKEERPSTGKRGCTETMDHPQSEGPPTEASGVLTLVTSRGGRVAGGLWTLEWPTCRGWSRWRCPRRTPDTCWRAATRTPGGRPGSCSRECAAQTQRSTVTVYPGCQLSRRAKKSYRMRPN